MARSDTDTQPAVVDERAARLRKLEALEQSGASAYPHIVSRTHTANDVLQTWAYLSAGESAAAWLSIVGRVMAVREHGRTVFVDIHDASGPPKLQLCVESRECVSYLREYVDIGDWLEVAADAVVRTKRGELSLRPKTLRIASKCLEQPIVKSGRGDGPGRHRGRRYLDLMFSPARRSVYEARAAIIAAIREHLDRQGFLAVETPLIQEAYGGADARPFVTECNALKQTLYIRISPELHLKRLLVAGYAAVYEIGPSGRNEGLDRLHHPEFTMLEAYRAFDDLTGMMTLTEELFAAARRAAHEVGLLPLDDRDWSPPWPRVPFYRAISNELGAEIDPSTPVGTLRSLAKQAGVDLHHNASPSEIGMALLDKLVEPTLVGPVFITDWPSAICPLTKPHRDDPRLAERFELFIDGVEYANAYTELNDPRMQEVQFRAQEERRGAGDDEVPPPDYSFVEALRYGMPPAGGLGIGLDRLVMLLLGIRDIRDARLFPLTGGGG